MNTKKLAAAENAGQLQAAFAGPFIEIDPVEQGLFVPAFNTEIVQPGEERQAHPGRPTDIKGRLPDEV